METFTLTFTSREVKHLWAALYCTCAEGRSLIKERAGQDPEADRIAESAIAEMEALIKRLPMVITRPRKGGPS